MKKSTKLSLTMALMVGATTGMYTIAPPQEASAEISDKFRMEINGTMSYYKDSHNLGGYAPSNVYDNSESLDYWTNYTRIQLNYHQDKNTKFQARLHSDYETFGTDYGKSSDVFFDQSFLELKDPKANIVYTIGKKGAYLGQGLVHNSTGNLSGAQISFGNWYDPTCLQLIAGRKKNGSNFFAANFTHQVTKPWQLSLTYIHHDTKNNYLYKEDAAGTTTGTWSDGSKSKFSKADYDHAQLHLVSIGSKVKAKNFTVQGEYVRNLSDKVAYGRTFKSGNYLDNVPDASKSSRTAWYVEVFTGPTSDMTSGLPLQKPGTNVWSLKYQDVGANAVDAHNPTFYDDARGWRLNYGHTFKKGLAGDIAIARMKDKGGNESGDYYNQRNGSWKTLVMAELSFKFR